MTNLMQGKRGVIMGVANERSIAWGIAQQLSAAGAELAFTYLNDSLAKRVNPLAASLNSNLVVQCDVGDDASIAAAFAEISQKWGKIDFVVHAIAYSDKNELRGRFINTSRDNFKVTMDASAYSLVAVAAAAEPIMNVGGSILTLSYYGAEKVVPNYNVMGVAKAALEASVRYLAADMGAETGIRVNAISAGPIKTLAASAIGDFKSMLDSHKKNSPLRRNTSTEDVGKASLFYLSDLSSGVTGEVTYVDCGANIMGAVV